MIPLKFLLTVSSSLPTIQPICFIVFLWQNPISKYQNLFLLSTAPSQFTPKVSDVNNNHFLTSLGFFGSDIWERLGWAVLIQDLSDDCHQMMARVGTEGGALENWLASPPSCSLRAFFYVVSMHRIVWASTKPRGVRAVRLFTRWLKAPRASIGVDEAEVAFCCSWPNSQVMFFTSLPCFCGQNSHQRPPSLKGRRYRSHLLMQVVSKSDFF